MDSDSRCPFQTWFFPIQQGNRQIVKLVSVRYNVTQMKNRIDVWKLFRPGFGELLLREEQILSDGDRKAREKFHRPADMERFTINRIFLKIVLAKYSGIPAGKIEIKDGRNGKPHLFASQLAPPFHFNLSYAGDYSVLAVSDGHIGIDIEQIRPLRDFESVAAWSCTADELDFLFSSPEAERTLRFFQIWVRKEASIKAVAEQAMPGLAGFPIVVPAEKGTWRFLDRFYREEQAWNLRRSLQIPGYETALCTSLDEPENRTFDLAETLD